MKRAKKCIAVVLCLFLSTFGLPALASVEPAAAKSQLSDDALTQAVGGTYEARIMTRLNGKSNADANVQALFLNYGGSNNSDGSISGAGCNASYRFEVLGISGTVVQTLSTGQVNMGTTLLVNGVVLGANNINGVALRAVMECINIPTVRAEATSRRVN